MSSAWRTRCPEGHSNIESRKGPYYICLSCETRYAGEPLDAAEHEFPVEGRKREEELPSRFEVLTELVRLYEEGRTEIKAKELGHKPSAANHLGRLRQRGLVEKRSRARGSSWLPTERGIDVAQSDGLDRDSDGQMLEGTQP